MTPELDDQGLVGGRCAACHRPHFPQAPACPWCGTDDPAPVRLSDQGTVWAATVVTAAPPGYTGEVPYGFGVVELPADGLRVVTRFTGPVAPGDPVRYTVAPIDDATTTWAFAPDPTADDPAADPAAEAAQAEGAA
jgi:uncharacterized OB-fold protein